MTRTARGAPGALILSLLLATPPALAEDPSAIGPSDDRPSPPTGSALTVALTWPELSLRIGSPREPTGLAVPPGSDASPAGAPSPPPARAAKPAPASRVHRLSIRGGDSLSRIFQREGISKASLARLLASPGPTRALGRLRPGRPLEVAVDERGRVLHLSYGATDRRSVVFRRDRVEDGFHGGWVDSAETTTPPSPDGAPVTADAAASEDAAADADPTPQTATVRSGDSLSRIFRRLGVPQAELAGVLAADREARALRRIRPGQRITLWTSVGGALLRLRVDTDPLSARIFERTATGFRAREERTPVERRVVGANGEIAQSLFLAGRRSGLPDRLIMEMAEIFGWDVDFALDIRRGDRFSVLYQEVFTAAGRKIGDGPIVAAEFVNQGRTYRALRYVFPDGRAEYFTPDGESMRKAFLRTPVRFSRITSRFSRGRKHPILHRMRAHRGVDYGAPRGTPVKAAGDGRVKLAGRKGGFGKTVIVSHGGAYTTLYAHLSRFAKGVRGGKRVRQGQVIGYVGSTGLATGPHLHYEFRVRGVHRNPLTVALPRAAPIAKQYRADFRSSTRGMLAKLEALSATRLAAQ